MSVARVGASYFGKLPAQGDFVRAASDHVMIAWLDRWVVDGMVLLAAAEAWPHGYDDAPGIHFAFLGPRNNTQLCGHLVASRDASGRRYPLLAVIRLHVEEPLRFMGYGPLAMADPWSRLARLLRSAVEALHADSILAELAAARCTISPYPEDYAARFSDFLETTSVQQLEAATHAAGHGVLRMHHVLPALGLLLQPAFSGGKVPINRALVFPLVADPLRRPMVVAFWLDVLAVFLPRVELELCVLVRNDDVPLLVVGFNGADPQALHAALDPKGANHFLVHVLDSAWVENYLDADAFLRRLADGLLGGELSLVAAKALFVETFIGA